MAFLDNLWLTFTIMNFLSFHQQPTSQSTIYLYFHVNYGSVDLLLFAVVFCATPPQCFRLKVNNVGQITNEDQSTSQFLSFFHPQDSFWRVYPGCLQTQQPHVSASCAAGITGTCHQVTSGFVICTLNWVTDLPVTTPGNSQTLQNCS